MSAPPAGGDQNRGPALVAIYWAETSFAILAVALRLYGRKLINGFGADDYMMVFTLVRTPFLFLCLTSNHTNMYRLFPFFSSYSSL